MEFLVGSSLNAQHRFQELLSLQPRNSFFLFGLGSATVDCL